MSELIFLIEDDPDGGYTAQAIGQNIFTQADTIDELKPMIQDAIDCHLNNRSQWPALVRLHFIQMGSHIRIQT